MSLSNKKNIKDLKNEIEELNKKIGKKHNDISQLIKKREELEKLVKNNSISDKSFDEYIELLCSCHGA